MCHMLWGKNNTNNSESTKGRNSNFNQGQPWKALETTCRMAVEQPRLWSQEILNLSLRFTTIDLTLDEFLTSLKFWLS